MIFIQIKSKTKEESGNTVNINETRTVEITPEYIKKTLKFNESNVLQINIKYPAIKIKPGSVYKKAEKKFNGFYLSTVKNFSDFCEKNLENGEYTGEFKPFGAVVTFEAAYNKQDFLCIYFDVNIYSGKGRGNTVRKAHIWKFGKNNIELVPPDKFVPESVTV